MVDGTATTQMLERFEEIGKVLADADTAIDELLQVNPNSQEVMAFKGYIDMKLQKLAAESRSMRGTFNNSPNIAGSFCAGCKKNISFGSQAFVFRKVSTTQMEVWHLPCFEQKPRTGN